MPDFVPTGLATCMGLGLGLALVPCPGIEARPLISIFEFAFEFGIGLLVFELAANAALAGLFAGCIWSSHLKNLLDSDSKIVIVVINNNYSNNK